MKLSVEAVRSLLRAAPLGTGVRVLDCNSHGLVALEKPCGVMSHPNSAADIQKSLLRCKYSMKHEKYSYTDDLNKEKDINVYLLNRLDSATSGVILICYNEDVASTVRKTFASQQIHKLYRAILVGALKSKSATWTDSIKTVNNKYGALRSTVFIGPGGESAVTSIKQLQKCRIGGMNVTSVELVPLTGRTHQLRLHCAHNRVPILGDEVYGNFSFNQLAKKCIGTYTDRLYLHCQHVSFEYEYLNTKYAFSASSSIPPCFDAFLK
jgi:tRNA pseudouridine65 synthase